MTAVVDELGGIETWLYGLLSADPTMQALVGNPARVYSGLGPETAVFPFVVIRQVSSPDVIATGGGRVMTRAITQIDAYDKSSTFANCQDIMKQVETLIGNQTGTTSDTRILSCVRQQIRRLVDPADQAGNVYRRVMGLYQIQAQPL